MHSVWGVKVVGLLVNVCVCALVCTVARRGTYNMAENFFEGGFVMF